MIAAFFMSTCNDGLSSRNATSEAHQRLVARQQHGDSPPSTRANLFPDFGRHAFRNQRIDAHNLTFVAQFRGGGFAVSRARL